MKRLGLGAVIAAVALWPAARAGADQGNLVNPGPCNVIAVFTDTDELQDDIFDQFTIDPEVHIQWVRADQIDTYFDNVVNTGTINCSTTNGTTSAQLTPAAGHGGASAGHQTATHTTTVTGPISYPSSTTSSSVTNVSATNTGTIQPAFRVRRVGPILVLPSRRAVGKALPGHTYQLRIALYRHGRLVKGPLTVRFSAACRIQSSVGCLG
jgi:hypothetical protein